MLTTLVPKLPPGKKYAVCLSLDFDTFSFRVGRMKNYSPVLISRGEFGDVGARRILNLLSENSIKATWFIPGYTTNSFRETVEKIHSEGHEIGHHNFLHETPLELGRDQEAGIIDRANAIIEEVTGSKARGYRSPSWDLSENTLDLILERGFLYDSSLMAHDYLPYYVRSGDSPGEDGFRFGNDTRMIEIPVSWSLEDYPVFEMDDDAPGMGLRDAEGVQRNWIADFDYMTEHMHIGVYTLTAHPQVIGRGHRMKVLENVIAHIMERDDTVFMKMEDLASSCIP